MLSIFCTWKSWVSSERPALGLLFDSGDVAGDALERDEVPFLPVHGNETLVRDQNTPIAGDPPQFGRAFRDLASLDERLDDDAVVGMDDSQRQAGVGVEFGGTVAGDPFDRRADELAPRRMGIEPVAEKNVGGIFGQAPEPGFALAQGGFGADPFAVGLGLGQAAPDRRDEAGAGRP
jgi:hypothetical protein